MLKRLTKRALHLGGIEARRIKPPASVWRPTARTFSVLEDLRARAFTPPLFLISERATAAGRILRLPFLNQHDSSSSSRDLHFRVPVTTIDALAKEWGTPDFIKMDLEGFQIEALKGARSVLGKTELFLIEVALFRYVERPVLHEVIAFMADAGYWLYDVGDPIRRPFDGALGLVDLFLARVDGVLRRAPRAWYAAVGD